MNPNQSDLGFIWINSDWKLPWQKFRIGIYFETIRTIPIHSDICIRVTADHPEPIWIMLRLMKNGQNTIRLNPILSSHQSEWIRTSTNQVYNLNHFYLGFIWIDSDWKLPGQKFRIGIYSETIRTIPIHSDICIRATADHPEPIWKMFCTSFDEERSKNNST